MKNSKKKSKQKKQAPFREDELFEDMLERIGVVDWDIVLVGDGSGSNYSQSCGWGCVSIERSTFKRECWTGCMSIGTVNLAEMLAYIQPLSCFVAREQKRREKGGRIRFLNVHIITDSNYVRESGEGGNLTPRRNGSLWRIFDDFVRQGLILHWHWIPRETVELNCFADALSKAARILIKNNDVQECVEAVDGPAGRTVYDFNPSH